MTLIGVNFGQLSLEVLLKIEKSILELKISNCVNVDANVVLEKLTFKMANHFQCILALRFSRLDLNHEKIIDNITEVIKSKSYL